VVVFTQFRGTQAAMMARLNNAKIPCFELNGDTKPADRVKVVNEWARSAPGVIVCMIQVAGVGLNMTAASKMIFLDKLFVPKLNEQAQDRCYRMGADLTQPVQVFEIIARKTIEQRIEKILREKMQLFDELIETPVWRREFFKALIEASDDDA
jgi:SNF2 family DNA or RNA helicase